MTSPAGGSLGSLFVSVEPDMNRFGPELNRGVTRAGDRAAAEAGPGVGRKIAKGIGAGIAAGTGIVAVGLAKGIKSSVDQARDLNETIQKSSTVFGKNSKDLDQWARALATDMGQSRKAAMDGATTFAIYGKAAGKAGDDLFNFSTDLVGLAGDMASFSNTSPEEAIEAIGAAMRGEADPIEKYGVLMNDATLKNIALKKGIIDTTKAALTPQQRVLAVQALLFEQLGNKGSKALGDFERNSAGLANQQRIAKAQITNLSAEIGQSFLPVVTRVVTLFNKQWIPAMTELWRTHGPAIVAWATTAADRFGKWAGTLSKADITSWLASAKAAFDRAAPAISQFFTTIKDNAGTSASDTLKVTGTAMQFLADNADLLGKALPYLAAGLVAYKVSQLAANVAAVAAPIATAANAIATRQLARATTQLAATQAAATITTGAQTAATTAGAAATGRASVATRLFGAAIRFAMGPIGIIITVVAALAAGIVWLYKNNETARRVIDASWKWIKNAISAVGNWITGKLWPSLMKAYDQGSAAVRAMVGVWRAQWTIARNVISNVWGAIRRVFEATRDFIMVKLPNAFRTGVGAIGKWWNNLKETAAKPVRFVINTVFNKMSGVFNKVADFLHLPKNLRAPTLTAGFAAGGRIHGAPSSVDNRVARGPGGEPIGLAGGEYIINAKQTSKHLPLLERINRGFAGGGLFDFLGGPAKWIRGKVGGVVDQIRDYAGDSLLGKLLTHMGKTVVGGLIERAKGVIGDMRGGSGQFGKWPSSPSAQRGDSGVWRSIVALINSTGPLSGAFGNGYRPGDPKWHGSGRAVDWMGFNQDRLASWLAAMKPLELIHRTASRDYAYTRGVNKGSFNQSLMEAHRNHIHVAMAKGGRIPVFDRGGVLERGFNIVNNRTGNREALTPTADLGPRLDTMIALLSTLAGAIGSVVGQHVASATRGADMVIGRRANVYARTPA